MNLAVSPAREAAILIVDDAAANIDVLRSMMAQQGYQTFVATSGERALSIARRVHPDLILLDVMMPGMDGLETCRQLKLHPGTEDIPVIFMSARTGTDDVVAGLDLGAVDYIGKPLRMAEVCARVRAQLHVHSHSETRLEQAQRLRMIVDNMAEGLMIIETSGRIQYSNPACDTYLGYGARALAGHALGDLLAAPLAQEYIAWFGACNNDPGDVPALGAREVAIRQHDGTTRAMDLTVTPMHTAGEQLFIGLLHDISHRKQYESTLERAALVDPLTKIANRRHFDNFFEQEWQRAVRSGEPLSLLVLDVDHFKLYNDALGHAQGDLALLRVAEVLTAHAMRPTDLAARYGGEEFVLLFGETEAEAARKLAESIRARIEALGLPNPRSPTSAWVTASIGVATIVPNQLDDVASFFVEADRAMYAAKDAGRNAVMAVDAGSSTWEALKAMVKL
ncbi:MAG: diguanylate cyclase [Pseudomonadota bacterium]